MISVNEEVRHKLTSADYAVAGGVSGVVTRCSCQPLDVIKIRFQLQVEPIRKDAVGVKYWSISQATQQIIKDEGISALWKGHVPAQLLSVLYGVAQFSSFEFFSKVASKESQKSPHIHFICGASAGCFATVASFPCDVIRTRLVAQGEPKVYSGICDAALKIYTKEGSKAFFKGLSPTLIQVAPHTGAQFAFYAGFKEVWRKLGLRCCRVVGILAKCSSAKANDCSSLNSEDTSALVILSSQVSWKSKSIFLYLKI